jgi:hypothetical protein
MGLVKLPSMVTRLSDSDVTLEISIFGVIKLPVALQHPNSIYAIKEALY